MPNTPLPSPRYPTPAIAIIGMAARFAGADHVERYWSNLVDGVESVSREDPGPGDDDGRGGSHFVRAAAKLDDVEWFDADYFRIPPTEAITMDPQQRVLLEVAATALEDAGYAGQRDAVVGVFVGSGENHYFREFVAPSEALAGRTGDVRITLSNEKDFLAPRLAFKLGFTGPAITVQTGCATSLSAVSLACAALAAGDCDIALAGGVSLLMPDFDGYTYTEGGILSSDGRCRAFDANASGTVPGAGAGIVVLKRDAAAEADRDTRRALIRGWAVNNDGGARAGFTAPNVAGQEAVVRAALKRADISPEQVGYIEAHGTGTAIGDPVEFEALRRIFATPGRPSGTLRLGTVKPNIGHTDAAAGVAGLIKATLAVERATVPGTPHFREPNPEIDLDSTPFVLTADTQPWNSEGPRVAGVSSFGLGGSNAHVVIESVPGRRAPTAETSRPRQVLALSARTDEELERMRAHLVARLDEASPQALDSPRLADVAFTLAVGRPRFARRWATVVSGRAEALERLRDTAGAVPPVTRWSLTIRISPAEAAVMGQRLLAVEPLARSVDAELRQAIGLSEPAGGPEGLASRKAGALAVLGVTRVLRRLGLTFARVEAPRWAQPAVDWFADGADPGSLAAALEACSDGADPIDGEDTGARAGRITVDPSFDLADVVATAWRAGVAVKWAEYHGEEPLGRVPLPAYPFTRSRLWLDRPEEPPRAEPESAGGESARASTVAGATTAAVRIEKVWRDVLGVRHPIAHDARFVDDLGGDSLYAVEIGARLNEEFGLDLPTDLPFVAPTITTAARYVAEALLKETTS